MPVSFFSSTSDQYTYPFENMATYSQSIKQMLVSSGWQLLYEGDGLTEITEENLKYFDYVYAASGGNVCNTKDWLYGNTGAQSYLDAGEASTDGSLPIFRCANFSASGNYSTDYLYLGCKNKFNVISMSGQITATIRYGPIDKKVEYFNGTWTEVSGFTDTTSSSPEISGWTFGNAGKISYTMPTDWVMGGAGMNNNYYYIRIYHKAERYTVSGINGPFCSKITWMVPQDIAPGSTPKIVALNSAEATGFYQIYKLGDSHSTEYPIYVKVTYTALGVTNGAHGVGFDISKEYNSSTHDLINAFPVNIAKTDSQYQDYLVSKSIKWYISAYDSGVCFVTTASGAYNTSSIGLLFERARDLRGNILGNKMVLFKFNSSESTSNSSGYVIDYDFMTYETNPGLFLTPAGQTYDADFTGKYTTTDNTVLGIGPMFLGNGLYGSPRLLIFLPSTSVATKNLNVTVKQDGVLRTFYVPSLQDTTPNTPYKSLIALART